MARTNGTRRRPETEGPLTLSVVRRERLSPGFARVTLGGDDLGRFRPLGFDQWFRMFIPVAENSLEYVPQKFNTTAYLRYLTVSKTARPAIRNLTVRAFRPDGPDGPELDVDFVVHDEPGGGTAGPASTFAQTCEPGDAVAVIDEGTMFGAIPGRPVHLVADESGLPAVAGILASLPADATGTALVEVAADEDRRELAAPDGVEVTWVVRPDPRATPGRAALAAALDRRVPTAPVTAWTVGESGLPTSLRRHWVKAGVPKEDITFCGYWKKGKSN